MAVALAAGALLCALMAPAQAQSVPSARVTFAVVSRGTTVAELARIPGMSPGLMSAGIGRVPSEQTFLDVSQGNRIDDTLYDRDLLGIFPFAREVPGWPEAVARAREAPADLTPGLLASHLRSAGVPSSAEQPMTAEAIVAAEAGGSVGPLRPATVSLPGPRLAVISSDLRDLTGLIRRLAGDDLLIVLAAPPPDRDRALPIGIAGRGFDGNLTSDSTRTDGYVLSTDIASTVLARFGLPAPGEMDGEPIRSEGSVDPEAVVHLGDRMAVVPGRRAPLLIACLGAWIAIAAVSVGFAPGARRFAAAWLALAFAYMPLMLLAGAWLEPGPVVEGLLVGFGAAILAALTIRFASGWRGLAIACAITVIAYAIDVIAGSGLTRLSLLGPNPIFGVRFYGIGNELEALFAVMVPAGVGATLSAYSGWGRQVTRGGAVAAFLLIAAAAAVIFGAGRFGADIGAVIVLPIGAAVAVVSLPASMGSEVFARHGPQKASKSPSGRCRWRVVATVVVAPFIALGLLALVDLVSGGNAHFTRSVLDAGGASNLADVAQRRLELSAHGFAQAAGNPLFWIVVVGIGLAITQWRRIDAWLRPAPIARAGLLGACAAVAVGVLVNDSGATFLVLGSLALGAFLAFAWSQTGEIASSPRNPEANRV
ncbi:MAG TPA: hypothetical protein VIZ61_14575 [Solirubrobacterales bacterium]